MTRAPAAQVEHQMRFREILERVNRKKAGEAAPERQLGPFVTVSRMAGSGGAEIARRLGERIGWAVLDRELVDEVAEKLKLEPGFLELVDETRANWFSDTLYNLLHSRLVLQDSYVEMIGKLILLAAWQGQVVIVGRGAHLLLPADTGLRVRVVAPRELRVQRLAAEQGLDRVSAERRLDEVDRAREEYVRRHFGMPAGDPFDLVLDAGAFGVDGTVELLLRALELRGLLAGPGAQNQARVR